MMEAFHDLLEFLNSSPENSFSSDEEGISRLFEDCLSEEGISRQFEEYHSGGFGEGISRQFEEYHSGGFEEGISRQFEALSCLFPITPPASPPSEGPGPMKREQHCRNRESPYARVDRRVLARQQSRESRQRRKQRREICATECAQLKSGLLKLREYLFSDSQFTAALDESLSYVEELVASISLQESHKHAANPPEVNNRNAHDCKAIRRSTQLKDDQMDLRCHLLKAILCEPSFPIASSKLQDAALAWMYKRNSSVLRRNNSVTILVHLPGLNYLPSI